MLADGVSDHPATAGGTRFWMTNVRCRQVLAELAPRSAPAIIGLAIRIHFANVQGFRITPYAAVSRSFILRPYTPASLESGDEFWVQRAS